MPRLEARGEAPAPEAEPAAAARRWTEKREQSDVAADSILVNHVGLRCRRAILGERFL